LVVRDVRMDELDEAARVMKAAYEEYSALLPPGRWQEYQANIIDVRSRLPVAELIVAEIKGVIVGAVTLFLKPSGTPESWTPGWAGIRLLAVHPDYRGLGIGRALMDECVRRCRAGGIATIGLHTTEMMAVARRMYEKMGFKRAPEFDFHPSPQVVVMAYRLDLATLSLRDT
jgi:ribosomal protein S18 acetylase RimI-like enzyme